MPRTTLYLDEATDHDLREAAAKHKKSRSAWVAETIRERLSDDKPKPFPADWLETFGSWKDDRSAEEIIADIKGH